MDGILLIDKPEGMTSHDVISRLRRFYKQKKFGHTGTLDPDASGLLIVLCGKACKVLQFLQDTDKTYDASIQLGSFTSTDDIHGEILQTKPVDLSFSFESELKAFIGPLQQKVPAISAKKVAGKKLMDYQRQNLEVPEVYADVEVYDIESLDSNDLSFRVHCSSGTYVRSICRDLAIHTNNAGCMKSLRRISVGRFSVEDAYQLSDLPSEPTLYSIESVLSHIEAIHLEDCTPVYQGKSIRLDALSDEVCIYDQNEPIAIYTRHHGQIFSSKRGLW